VWDYNLGRVPASPESCGCLEPEEITAPSGSIYRCTNGCNYYGKCLKQWGQPSPPDVRETCAKVSTLGWVASRTCATAGTPLPWNCRFYTKVSSAFKSEASLQQLMLQLYNIGAAPRAYSTNNASQTPCGVNLLPRIRRQGRCGTCVAHAIAAGIEAALGSSLQQDPRSFSFSISAGSIYFCSKGGCTFALLLIVCSS
jgi:hypothetical protein